MVFNLSLYSERTRQKIYMGMGFGVIVLILVVFITFLATKSLSGSGETPKMKFHSKCPEEYKDHPLFLLSLDGFRDTYLRRGITPTLRKLADRGVSAVSLVPVFPSNTFPNHYSIVTGLHPESHGIVDNIFYDRSFDETFTYKRSIQYEGRWWGGEPIWNTIKKRGMKSATYFWVGSEAPINGRHPDWYKKFNKSIPFDEIIHWVVEKMTLPSELRPRFLAAYFNQPDFTGHRFGPHSDEINEKLAHVDDMIKLLLERLREKRISNCVNIMIVSDHGMTSVGEKGRIPIEDFFGNVTEILESPLRNFEQFNIKKEYSDWRETVEQAFSCASGDFRLYKREDLPNRLHYSNNDRIGDYVFLLNSGKMATVHSDFYMEGDHGYDNQYSDMNGIFIGYGPDLKKGVTVEPFQNIELYNLMCRLLDVTPAPNNGTPGALDHLLRRPPPLPKTLPEGDLGTILHLPDNFNSSLEFEKGTVECEDSPFNSSNLASMVKDLKTAEIERILNPWGLPLTVPGNPLKQAILYHPDHITGFSQLLKLPLWSSYSINARPETKMTDNFNWSLDARVPAEFQPPCQISQEKSYKNRSFSLMPLFHAGLSTDESWSLLSSLNSNAVPISSYLSPKWKIFFDSYLPRWFEYHGPLHVTVGPIFDQDADGSMDKEPFLNEEGVAIPSHIYAVVVKCDDLVDKIHHCDEDHLDAIAFMLPQHLQVESCFEKDEFLKTFLSSLKDVEKISQLIFLPKLHPARRMRLSLRIKSDIWH